jgi:hypothetical protein
VALGGKEVQEGLADIGNRSWAVHGCWTVGEEIGSKAIKTAIFANSEPCVLNGLLGPPEQVSADRVKMIIDLIRLCNIGIRLHNQLQGNSA